GSTGLADNEYYQFDFFAAGACTPPMSLSSTGATATSASISWVLGGGTATDIDYGAPGHTAGAGTIINVASGTTHTITGLSAATSYDIYVRSSCTSSKSSWVGPININTLCNPIVPVVLPFTEGFESYSGTYMAAAQFCQNDRNWSYSNTDPTGRLRFNAGTGFAKTGSSAVTMDKTPAGSLQTNRLDLTIDLSNYLTKPLIALSFYYMHHGEESQAGDRVFARGNNTMPWVEIYNLFANQGAAGQYNHVQNLNLVNLLGAAGQTVSSTTQIRFSQEDDNPATSLTISDGYTFDDISIIANDCGSVSNFVVTGVSGSSVNFSWLGLATGTFDVEWGPVGFVQGTGATLSVSNNTSAGITGLSDHTSYWVYVRQNCSGTGNGLGLWSGPHLVTTAYVPPYFQDFVGGYPGVSEFTEAKGLAKNPTVFTNTTTSNWIVDGFSNVG
ncbi:MAG: fibronectin type III domain-containing protein, partial [Owenweeksia sp.]